MNISREIQKAQVWLQLFPIIIGLIRSIELILPEEGKGSAKIEMLRIGLTNAYEGLGNILGSFDDIWPKVAAMVTSLITVFNKTGIFKKVGAS